MFTKINPVESGYFWGKSWYFNEKSLKNGKPQIHNSFFLIHCNFIIISKLQVLSVNLKLLTKINPVESGYFWGKSWYFNEKSLKMENFRYVIVSSLYIAIVLSFRSLRYNLST